MDGCLFFFQAEDGIRDLTVTGVQTCALPILRAARPDAAEPALWRAHCRSRLGRPQRRRTHGSGRARRPREDRKSTRLNSSHSQISYAVFCLKKKKKQEKVSNTARHRIRKRA